MDIKLPILDKAIVESLIPQKAPFVMVDKLLAFKENEIIAGIAITNDNLFTTESVFQEAGLVEHMAQTVALYTGYQYYLRNEKPPTGYIGSIKTITINRLPNEGEEVVTTVNVLHEFMGVTLVNIVSKVNEIEIAKGQMKTVIAT